MIIKIVMNDINNTVFKVKGFTSYSDMLAQISGNGYIHIPNNDLITGTINIERYIIPLASVLLFGEEKESIEE